MITIRGRRALVVRADGRDGGAQAPGGTGLQREAERAEQSRAEQTGCLQAGRRRRRG